MSILLEEEIQKLVKEKKILPKDYPKKIQTKLKSGFQHEQRELIVNGINGHIFSIVLRKNKIDFLDFSIILRYKEETTNIWYNLARYNGKHTHTNFIEKNTFHDFHSHYATQRYQEAGLRIEGFAKINSSYKTFKEAIESFLKDFNFQIELPESATTLIEFGGG
jgi:hypothetical protein